MKIAAVVLMLTATTALADDLPYPVPALYDVTAVAADDVLNVRALPDANSEVIGEFAPHATALEVVKFSRKSEWALVNAEDQSGWVSMRFLVPRKLVAGPYGLPAEMRCFGTEPFWNARITEEGLEMSTPDSTSIQTITAVFAPMTAPADLGQGVLVSWLMDGKPVRGQIIPGQCSDGMSNRSYALHYIDEVLGWGCCSIAP